MEPRVDRRRYERVRLGGAAVLIVDPRHGVISSRGHLVDLAEGGCQLRLRSRVEQNVAGKVRLELAGKQVWFPVITRWVRCELDGWTVRCAFEHLTNKKTDALRTALFDLSLSD